MPDEPWDGSKTDMFYWDEQAQYGRARRTISVLGAKIDANADMGIDMALVAWTRRCDCRNLLPR